MKSQLGNHQLNLPPTLLANETQEQPLRPKCTQPADPEVLSAELFDQALSDAHISTAEVAYLFKVSESLVRRMRNKDARERVSLAQLLKLPPMFWWRLQKLLNKRFNFGRAALIELLDAAGALAVVNE